MFVGLIDVKVGKGMGLAPSTPCSSGGPGSDRTPAVLMLGGPKVLLIDRRLLAARTCQLITPKEVIPGHASMAEVGEVRLVEVESGHSGGTSTERVLAWGPGLEVHPVDGNIDPNFSGQGGLHSPALWGM